jgi:hypothetical protein
LGPFIEITLACLGSSLCSGSGGVSRSKYLEARFRSLEIKSRIFCQIDFRIGIIFLLIFRIVSGFFKNVKKFFGGRLKGVEGCLLKTHFNFFGIGV